MLLILLPSQRVARKTLCYITSQNLNTEIKRQRNACCSYRISAIMGRDSSVGIATRYGLYGPGIESRWGARFSAPVQTGPGAYPASCTMGTGFFPGVKRPGRGVDHPPSYSAEVKERVGLCLYSTSGPSWPLIDWTSTFTFISAIKSRRMTNFERHVTYKGKNEKFVTEFWWGNPEEKSVLKK